MGLRMREHGCIRDRNHSLGWRNLGCLVRTDVFCRNLYILVHVHGCRNVHDDSVQFHMTSCRLLLPGKEESPRETNLGNRNLP